MPSPRIPGPSARSGQTSPLQPVRRPIVPLAGHGPPRCPPCPLRGASPRKGAVSLRNGANAAAILGGPMEAVECSAPVLRSPPLRGHGRPCRLPHGRKRRPPPARRIRGSAPSRARPPFRGDAGRPRRRQGRRRGRQSQVSENCSHDLGIREERKHDHRNGPRGGPPRGARRAFGTREPFYMQHAAKKLLPGEPSSSRAWRLGGSARAPGPPDHALVQ